MLRFAVPLIALALAGCNASALLPDAAVVTPAASDASAAAALPEGGNCTGDIARYRAVQDQDLRMGHVAQSVYNKVKAEIAAAERECDAGHEARSRAMIIESRKRHGYPTDL